MDQEIEIINNNTRIEKIKNFLINYKKFLITTLIIIILGLFSFFSYEAYQDRSKENLGTTDIAVVRMRRLMLRSVKDFMKEEKPPLGINIQNRYNKLRGEEAIVAKGEKWQEICKLGQMENI